MYSLPVLKIDEIYKRAAVAMRPPVHRLYFDTQAVRSGGWPIAGAQLERCLTLAWAMGIEPCMPAPALHERMEQWVRETLSALDTAGAKAKAARDALQLFGLEASVVFRGPEEAELRRSYEEASRLIGTRS